MDSADLALSAQLVVVYKDGDDSDQWDPTDNTEFRVPEQITPRHFKGSGCGVQKVMFDQGKNEIIKFELKTRLDKFGNNGQRQKIAPEEIQQQHW